MKILISEQQYKRLLLETGEWPSGIDLDYVNDNPDDDSEFVEWIKQLYNAIEVIEANMKHGNFIKLIDIKGFDAYQGPYALIDIIGKKYKFWLTGEEPMFPQLYIENFSVVNTDETQNPGYIGSETQIAEMLDNYIENVTIKNNLHLFKKGS